MASTSEFWTRVGYPAPSGPLEEPIRFRIETDLRKEIDRIEAYARGAGYRDVNRSDIIRVALKSFVDGFRAQEPGISSVSLPGERLVDGTTGADSGTTRPV